MASSKKEKHYPNSRARRHSGTVVVSQSKKSKKDKDTDTESVTSTTISSADTIVVPPDRKCPLRLILPGIIESPYDDGKTDGCPLRRVQLWHTIPLCLLAIINLLLVIIALLGLAGYRIVIGVQTFALSLAETKTQPIPEKSVPAITTGKSTSSKKT